MNCNSPVHITGWGSWGYTLDRIYRKTCAALSQNTHKLAIGMRRKFHATASLLTVLLHRPRLYGPWVYSGLCSYRHRPSTGRIYPIWPARVDPKKSAWKAVSGPIEMAPKLDEGTNTASEALFGVYVRLETWLSQAYPRRALSRL